MSAAPSTMGKGVTGGLGGIDAALFTAGPPLESSSTKSKAEGSRPFLFKATEQGLVKSDVLESLVALDAESLADVGPLAGPSLPSLENLMIIFGVLAAPPAPPGGLSGALRFFLAPFLPPLERPYKFRRVHILMIYNCYLISLHAH